MTLLHHFYHLYADGDFEVPVREHVAALRLKGLDQELATVKIGFVGTEENVARARALLAELELVYGTAIEAREGWEQVTLRELRSFCWENEGLVSYAHTKGAANFAEINWHWRRSMEYHNFVEWWRPVFHLERGAKVAGCHWFNAAPAANPAWGHSGMFGGNYWWARCDAIRDAPPLEMENRFQAEHWIGRLSEVTDLSGSFLTNLHPNPIEEWNLTTNWLQGQPPQ